MELILDFSWSLGNPKRGLRSSVLPEPNEGRLHCQKYDRVSANWCRQDAHRVDGHPGAGTSWPFGKVSILPGRHSRRNELCWTRVSDDSFLRLAAGPDAEQLQLCILLAISSLFFEFALLRNLWFHLKHDWSCWDVHFLNE